MNNHNPQKSVTDIVAEHYNKFPYPSEEVIKDIPRQNFFETNRLNYNLKRRKTNLFPQKMKIWIPGAGTDLAVKLGLSFPESEILATDISETALSTARRRSELFGVKNITFKVGDINQAQYKNEFDFIYCTGVLHHLPDPLKGLKVLNEALKPQGATFLYLYNTQLRTCAVAFQESLKILTLNSDDLDTKYSNALRIAENVSRKHASPLLKKSLRALLETNQNVHADQLMHPIECSYDMKQLFTFIADGGFRFSGWLNDDAWDVSNCIDNDFLLKRLSQKSDFEKYSLVYFLMGEFCPIYTFFIEKKEFEINEEYSEEEFLNLKLESLKSLDSIDLSNKSGAVSTKKPFQIDENKLFVRAANFPYQILEFQLPPGFDKIFSVADGTKTVRDLVAMFSNVASEEVLCGLLKKMLSKNVRLFVPNYY